jgi:hypothetical protein
MPGTSVHAIDIAEPAPRWERLGLDVRDGGCAVGRTWLRPGAAGTGPLPGWCLRAAPDLTARPPLVDGIPTRWTGEPPCEPGAHPLGAVAVDHVVVRTLDVARTVAALEAAGMRLRRELTRGEARLALFRHGECVVEVAGPAQPAGDEPARLWGLTLVCADLDAAVARLGPERCGPARDAFQAGRRIALATPQATSVPLALMTA